MKSGEIYKGPKAIFSGPEVGHVVAHYALDKEGNLLERNGEPVRLVQIDLAPGDPEDGSEEYRIAGKDDPPQKSGNVVELEPDTVHAKGESKT